MDISVIVPLYNEEESLPELEKWIVRVMTENNFSYEIVFVNDGSNDKSANVIKTLAKENKNVRGVSFRRNYGKSAALFCGFEKAEGDVIITMDADLQDSPDEIPGLFHMIKKEKYDLVSGWKKKRYDSKLTKNIPSKFYNYVARKVSGTKLHDMNCGLKAYRKNVIKSVEVYGEMHRYIPVLAKQAGFNNIGEKVVEHRKRQYGTTKFGMDRFVNGFLDLMTITFMSKFGKRPMHFFGLIGTIFILLGIIFTLFIGAYKWYALNKGLNMPLIADLPYFYIAITAIIIGSQMFLAGFLGELITRNSQERNVYLIEEEIGYKN
ncbi:MAG: glycosyltransferase family 2 protein [Bacteroidales bacterium]